MERFGQLSRRTGGATARSAKMGEAWNRFREHMRQPATTVDVVVALIASAFCALIFTMLLTPLAFGTLAQ
jgi:hypothetical protein